MGERVKRRWGGFEWDANALLRKLIHEKMWHTGLFPTFGKTHPAEVSGEAEGRPATGQASRHIGKGGSTEVHSEN